MLPCLLAHITKSEIGRTRTRSTVLPSMWNLFPSRAANRVWLKYKHEINTLMRAWGPEDDKKLLLYTTAQLLNWTQNGCESMHKSVQTQVRQDPSMEKGVGHTISL